MAMRCIPWPLENTNKKAMGKVPMAGEIKQSDNQAMGGLYRR